MKGSYHCGHVSNAKRRKAPNPLRIDPTRTAGLRRAFMAAVRRKFRKLAVEVVKLIRDEDALGLLPVKSFSFNTIATNNRWKYQSDPEKVKAFKAWLKSQIASQIIGKDEEELWQRYVEEGFRKGAGRAFDDTKKPLKTARDQSAMDFYAGSKDAFLRSAFGRPVAVEKVKLLAGRSFDDLEGITERMSRDMVRGLTDGLVRGMGPREIARELADDVGISQGRALLVARTECLAGDTLVDSAVVRAVFRRWYDGPIVEIVTRGGRKFSATSNHPMLTQDGWVSAGVLKQGDNLVCNNREQGTGSSGNQNVKRRPATLCEIFDSLSAVGVVERERTRKPDFHGDGLDGEVDILRPDRELFYGDFAPIGKPLVNNVFTPSGQSRSRFCPTCSRLLSVNEQPCLCRSSQNNTSAKQTILYQHSVNTECCSNRFHRLASEVSPYHGINVDVGTVLVMDAALLPRNELAFGIRTGNARLPENLSDLLLFRPNLGRNLALSEAGEVELDDVISVIVRPFSGHVYNLETPYGYYTIDGAYTGNTIRAHAEGQLMALEELGVEEVGVMVEWSTSGLGETALGNPSPCEKCAEMQGVVLKLDEARGLIPLHPGCLCSWIPANVNESTKDQIRGKSLIESAFVAADITSPSISERRPTSIF